MLLFAMAMESNGIEGFVRSTDGDCEDFAIATEQGFSFDKARALVGLQARKKSLLFRRKLNVTLIKV